MKSNIFEPIVIPKEEAHKLTHFNHVRHEMCTENIRRHKVFKDKTKYCRKNKHITGY